MDFYIYIFAASTAELIAMRESSENVETQILSQQEIMRRERLTADYIAGSGQFATRCLGVM